jgi:hypothetical protein
MLGQLVGWFGGDAGRVWFVRVLLPVLTYGFLVATAMNFGHAITVEGVEGQLHGWLERLAHERPFAGAALLAAALLLSTLLIQALDLRWTRLLEGYWPSWPVVRWSRRWHVFAHQCDHREMSRRLAELEGRREARPLDDETFAEREWLDMALERYPGPQALFMPTRFGNILRAAEQKIEARYGLNGVILWPRLWLVLPDAAKSELTAARSRIAFSCASGGCRCSCCPGHCSPGGWPWSA